jgi:hypothetical protein
MAKATKKAAQAPKAAIKKANGKTRTAFAPDAKITLLVKENPKRKDTKEHKRFAQYRNGMTVAQAYEAGMNALNLSRDIERKCIKVGG